jgi:hypothetical protein
MEYGRYTFWVNANTLMYALWMWHLGLKRKPIFSFTRKPKSKPKIANFRVISFRGNFGLRGSFRKKTFIFLISFAKNFVFAKIFANCEEAWSKLFFTTNDHFRKNDRFCESFREEVRVRESFRINFIFAKFFASIFAKIFVIFANFRKLS